MMVYNSVGPKERIPDIFGKKQYHRVSHNSDSLTSQIIAKRLNETGQLNQIQKLHSLQSPLSDYGKPTFYSSDTGARDRGDGVTNNAAVSDDARSGIKEVAKVFLGDRRPSGSKVSRYSKFHNIKQLLNANKEDEISRDNFDDIKVETDYIYDDDNYEDVTITTIKYYLSTPTSVISVNNADRREHETLQTPPYGYGVQHYEMETNAVTPSTDGDIALREIVHLLEDEG